MEQIAGTNWCRACGVASDDSSRCAACGAQWHPRTMGRNASVLVVKLSGGLLHELGVALSSTNGTVGRSGRKARITSMI